MQEDCNSQLPQTFRSRMAVPEEKEKLMRLVGEKKSLREMARTFGFSYEHIRTYLKSEGIAMQKKGTPLQTIQYVCEWCNKSDTYRGSEKYSRKFCSRACLMEKVRKRSILGLCGHFIGIRNRTGNCRKCMDRIHFLQDAAKFRALGLRSDGKPRKRPVVPFSPKSS